MLLRQRRVAAGLATLLATSGLVASGAAAPAVAAEPGTPVSGTIDVDTTWNAEDSPYVLTGRITIPEGVTLTIDEGVTVSSSDYQAGFDLAGAVAAEGSAAAPVIFDSSWGDRYRDLVQPVGELAELHLNHVESPFTRYLTGYSGRPAPFADLHATNSLLAGRLHLDGSTGPIELRRNRLVSQDLTINNPVESAISITDNRLRDSSLTCGGAGRLTMSGNTLERTNWQGSRISSQDDCLLTASENYWEATADQVGNRIQGAARVVVTPLADAPSVDTPALPPSQPSIYRTSNTRNAPVASVQVGSDGGQSATVVVIATNRETGEVEETHEQPMPSWRDNEQLRSTFTDLTPGALYRLSTYVENAQGKSAMAETESFIAPELSDPGPAPTPSALTDDTTWTADMSPIELRRTVTIPEGVTLTIEAGVSVAMAEEVCCRTPLFHLGGTINVQGEAGAPVRVDSGRGSFIRPLGESGVLEATGLDIRGGYHGGLVEASETTAMQSVRITRSRLRGLSLSVDVTQSSLDLTRSLVLGPEYNGPAVTLLEADDERVNITDNRFRDTRLSCGGLGRLDVSGNTFERTSGVVSNDDCVLDVSDNYWEASDSSLGNRIQGAGRVTALPTADQPTADTPTLAPHFIHIYNETSDGRVRLGVYTGSDGGAPSTVTATATDRESGEVVETHVVDLPSWKDNSYRSIRFTDLKPGGLYRLSANAENDQGTTPIVETESFLAPEPAPGPEPTEGTLVSGTISTDTTWTTDDSPVTLDGALTVPKGVNLSVEPGVIIRGSLLCCSSPAFRVAGSVVMTGSPEAPVVIETSAFWNSSGYVFTSPADTDGGSVALSGVRMIGEYVHLWRTSGTYLRPPASVVVVDSDLGRTRVSADGAFTSPVTLARNTVGGQVEIANPTADTLIQHNRFRNSSLGCSGTGRLDARANTFERSSTYLHSQNDCILDVRTSHWEAPDSEINGRIDGARRAVTLPSAATSAQETPRLNPATPHLDLVVTDQGHAVARGTLASDGGAVADLVIALVDRTNGDVVESRTIEGTSPGDEFSERFSGLSEGTLYRLEATAANKIGSSTTAATESFLGQQQAPPAPVDVTATLDATTATVTWRMPEDKTDGITGYTVVVEPSGESIEVAAPATTATFADLERGTSHTFTVTASNGSTTSPASEPSGPVTPPAPSTGGGGGGGGATPPPTALPAAPTEVSAERGDKSATVSWSAVTGNVGIYRVTVSPGRRVVDVAAPATSVVINGLQNGTAHTFTVAASTATGTGPASAASEPVVPAGRPGAVADLTSSFEDGVATLDWAAADPNGTPVTAYVVTVSPGGRSISVPGDSKSADVSGLAPGRSYTLTVRAENEIGTGEGASVELDTASAPTAPTSVTVTRDGASTLEVIWVSGDTNGAEVTGHQVTLSPGDHTQVAAPGSSSVRFEDLEPGTTYAATVVTSSNLGDSEPTTSGPVLVAAVPDRVEAPEADRMRRGIRVRWTAPDDNGAEVTSYVVTSNRGHQRTVAGDALERLKLVFKGLDEGRTYKFRVRAVNEVGTSRNGRWSDRQRW